MGITKQPACCRRVTVGGHEQLVIETAAGQRITLSDSAGSVAIDDRIGNSVVFDGGTVTVRAVGTIVLQASSVQIEAAQIALNAGTVVCSGILQADTVIANTVAATSYTPAAGNVW